MPTQPQAMMPTRLFMVALRPQALVLTSAMSSTVSSAMRMAPGAYPPRGMLAQYIAGMIRATPTLPDLRDPNRRRCKCGLTLLLCLG